MDARKRSALAAPALLAAAGLVLSMGAAGLAGEAHAPQAGGPAVILDEGSWWRRAQAYRTVVKRAGEKLEECKRGWFVTSSPPLPAGWERPDFDDASWARFRLARKRAPAVDWGFWQPI